MFQSMMRKSVIAILMVAFTCVSAGAQDVVTEDAVTPDAVMQEESAAAEDSVSPEAIFSIVGKLDFAREMMLIWWTDEVWASLAYKDKTPDAVLGYTMINMLNTKYVLFSPIPLSDSPAEILADPAPVLSGSSGVSVTAVPVHESFNKMLPGMLAFPAQDAEGNPVIAGDATELKLSVMFGGEGEGAEYKWELPMVYPDFVKQAYFWLDGRKNMDPTLLTEDELIFGQLFDKFRIDIGTGLMVAPVTQGLFDMFLATDHDLGDDPLVVKMVQTVVNEYTFFMVLTMDMAEAPERVRTLMENAVAVNAAGETLQRDRAAEKTFAESEMGDDEFVFLMFPKMTGEYKLIIPATETGPELIMTWN